MSSRASTPEIRIDDNPLAASANPSSLSPPRRPRLRATTQTSIDTSDAPWHRSSIRIRRGPSLQSISAAARANEESGAGRPHSGSGSVSRDFAEGAPSRQRAGSIGQGNARLRHESRNVGEEVGLGGGRRRSSSDPLRSWNQNQFYDSLGVPIPRRKPVSGQGHYMPDVAEETGRPSISDALDRPDAAALQRSTLAVPSIEEDSASEGQPSGRGFGRRLSAAGSMLRFPSFRPGSTASPPPEPPRSPTREEQAEQQYQDDMVDILDTVDPEVSTLNTLNNVQNSLFIPDLGRYLNRRPTYTLSRFPTKITEASNSTDSTTGQPTGDAEKVEEEEADRPVDLGRMQTTTSITSRLDDTHFAVLPHGERLRGWSAEERAELNDHVRHLLHSKREGFKRGMKGFGQYVRKPLGFFVTLYATLITLFGLAWVLFLIGWISVGNRKDYLVNVIDNVLVALFAIMGDGLAPFRAVDTYHMIFIAHYHHLTWRLRREKALPKLHDINDLPPLTVNNQAEVDLETGEDKLGEMSVLSPEQQRKLVHHQKKFSRSHTFYKPHETETHFAFPLRLLVAVVVLLDCHSFLQIALGTCTWAISYHVRPFALTTVILCCSITCNITAGVLISVGDHKTRKKDVLERMFRQQLTAEAMHNLEKKKEKEKRKSMDLERSFQATPITTPA